MNNDDCNAPQYQSLCDSLDIEALSPSCVIQDFADLKEMAEQSSAQRLTAALQVFIDLVMAEVQDIERIDKTILDFYIGKLDHALNEQLDEILHHPEFQQLESLWRSLAYLVERTNFNSNIKLEIIDISKQELLDDFNDVYDVTQSGLYQHLYIDEYDTPGGEPVCSMITDYQFDAGVSDINLLTNIAKVAAATHCPLIAQVAPQFFLKDNINDVIRIDDIENYMERAEYIRWNSFRQTEDSRYIGLTFPRFLVRLPYGVGNRTRECFYQENVKGRDAKAYLWGSASFAFAANLVNSFTDNGWLVNIRGPESGGKVEQLLLHQYSFGGDFLTKIPTECIIPETRELALANLGFIPLSYYKNSDYACFFSANSTQKPTSYDTDVATANSRINARLPYIYLSSRLAHYIKVLQREHIGSNISRTQLQQQLNRWLQKLVTKMNNPEPSLAAYHPLREAHVEVSEITDNPGFYRVKLYAMPHFQIEGIDVQLSMVSQLPTGKQH